MFCKSKCSPSNPATDSVRVDLAEVQRKAQEEVERFDMGDGRYVEKHGANRLVVGAKDPEEADCLVAEWQKEVQRRAEEQERKAKEEAESSARARAEQLARERAEEQRQHQEEVERAQREEERRLQEEQEQLRREEEEARLELEARQRREEEERRLAREREAQQRKEALSRFYAQHGFTGVNDARRSGCAVWAAATTYPLHCAAELADTEIVEMLLKEGANTSQKNSSGKTALQAVQRRNKAGSHDGVLQLLAGSGCGAARPHVGGA